MVVILSGRFAVRIVQGRTWGSSGVSPVMVGLMLRSLRWVVVVLAPKIVFKGHLISLV